MALVHFDAMTPVWAIDSPSSRLRGAIPPSNQSSVNRGAPRRGNASSGTPRLPAVDRNESAAINTGIHTTSSSLASRSRTASRGPAAHRTHPAQRPDDAPSGATIEDATRPECRPTGTRDPSRLPASAPCRAAALGTQAGFSSPTLITTRPSTSSSRSSSPTAVGTSATTCSRWAWTCWPPSCCRCFVGRPRPVEVDIALRSAFEPSES